MLADSPPQCNPLQNVSLIVRVPRDKAYSPYTHFETLPSFSQMLTLGTAAVPTPSDYLVLVFHFWFGFQTFFCQYL